MKIVVRQVGEIRPVSTDRICGADRLRNAHVRWMKRSEERIEHEHFCPDEELDHLVSYDFRVRYVRQGSNAVTENLDRSVRHREWKDLNAGDLRWFPVAKGNRATLRLRGPGERAYRIIEDVGKAARKALESVCRTIHLERCVASARDCTNVVEAVRVVGVIVRIQDSVDSIDSGRNELKAKLGRRVDEKPRPLVGFDDRANAVALVSRIGRMTDRAATANLRDTKTRSGAEERQLHSAAPVAAVTRFPLSAGS